MLRRRKRKPDYSKAPVETLRRMGRYIPPHKTNRNIPFIAKSFYWTERRLESLLVWLQSLALLEILGVISNIGILIAIATYVGTEKQRRDVEVLNAWQTITSASGQSGSGGRIQALEFLNASPGANWRRRASCLWLCTWSPESLDGINLAVSGEGGEQKDQFGTGFGGVYLRGIHLPDASLIAANLEGAELSEVDLEGATLWRSNLRGAFLLNANLRRVNLLEANLEGALLLGANLKGANLKRANLEGAYLREANLEEVQHLTEDQVTRAKLCQTKLPAHISLDPNRNCDR